jgi:DNA-directed RNA polymerase specialized sigma24 family protein
MAACTGAGLMSSGSDVTHPDAATASYQAFRRREYPDAVGLAYVVGGSRTGAEGVAGAVIERYGAKIRRGAAPPPTPSLHRAVAAAAASRHRGRGILRGPRRSTPPAVAVLPQQAADTWAAVRALPRSQTITVALAYYADMEPEAIATAADRSEAEVRAELAAARLALASRLSVTSDALEERLRDAVDAARDATAGVPRTAAVAGPRSMPWWAVVPVAAIVVAVLAVLWPAHADRSPVPVPAAVDAVSNRAQVMTLSSRIDAAAGTLEAIGTQQATIDSELSSALARFTVAATGITTETGPDARTELNELGQRIRAVGQRRDDVDRSFDDVGREIAELRALLRLGTTVGDGLPTDVTRSVDTLDLKLTVLQTQHDLLTLELEAVDGALNGLSSADERDG